MDICRKHGISHQMVEIKKYAGLGLNERRRLREERAMVKRLVADRGGAAECTEEMLYRSDRRHGLHHAGDRVTFQRWLYAR